MANQKAQDNEKSIGDQGEKMAPGTTSSESPQHSTLKTKSTSDSWYRGSANQVSLVSVISGWMLKVTVVAPDDGALKCIWGEKELEFTDILRRIVLLWE